MKLNIMCMQCILPPDTGKISYPLGMAKIDINENGIYDSECLKGHRSKTILQNHKFEILFEIGAYAIQDGYYREAISSFTSSLERLYEFFIRAACISEKIDLEQINGTWKHVVKQSERQLGAFIFIYLLLNKENPKLLSDKNIKFRNDVIHRGVIPSKKEAIEYGQSVLDVARPIIKILTTNHKDAINKLSEVHISDIHNKIEELSVNLATQSLTTILSLNYTEEEHNKRNLSDIIPNLFNGI